MTEINQTRLSVIIDNNYATLNTLKSYLISLVREDNIMIIDPTEPNYSKLMSQGISQGYTII